MDRLNEIVRSYVPAISFEAGSETLDRIVAAYRRLGKTLSSKRFAQVKMDWSLLCSGSNDRATPVVFAIVGTRSKPFYFHRLKRDHRYTLKPIPGIPLNFKPTEENFLSAQAVVRSQMSPVQLFMDMHVLPAFFPFTSGYKVRRLVKKVKRISNAAAVRELDAPLRVIAEIFEDWIKQDDDLKTTVASEALTGGKTGYFAPSPRSALETERRVYEMDRDELSDSLSRGITPGSIVSLSG